MCLPGAQIIDLYSGDMVLNEIGYCSQGAYTLLECDEREIWGPVGVCNWGEACLQLGGHLKAEWS